MTRLRYCIKALGIAVTLSLAAQGGLANEALDLQVLSKGKPHDFLYGVSFEGVNGVAVGDHGLLQSTADGGNTWNRLESPAPQRALLSIVRSNGRCLAGGQQGAILRSDDCVKWESVKAVTDARILGVHSNSKGEAYAVGGFGTILRSIDWGKTWQSVAIDWKVLLGTDAEPHLYAVQVAEDGAVTLTGEFELVLRSAGSAGRWEVLHKGERSLFGLFIGQKGRLFAVGQEGLILRSNDAGKTWAEINSGTKSVLTDVWASSDGASVIAVGVRTVLSSRDGGASFVADGSSEARSQIHSSVAGIEGQKDGLAVVIGGAFGSILRAKF
jgi:photosystem II stability/assembly factor-like uncharacterized protein